MGYSTAEILALVMVNFRLPAHLLRSLLCFAMRVQQVFIIGAIGAIMSAPSGSFADHPLIDQVRTVTAHWVKGVLDAGENLLLFDLRPVADFTTKKLPRAQSLPSSELEKRYREVPRFGRVVLYCACRQDDLIETALFLQRLGYRNIAVMPEGFAGWLKLGYPLEENRP